jgi:hypothetical protein
MDSLKVISIEYLNRLTTDHYPEDVWFHVDKVRLNCAMRPIFACANIPCKLSSAHVYLRLPPEIPSWDQIPQALLTDCAQLVKEG